MLCEDPNCPVCKSNIDRTKPHRWKGRHAAVGSPDPVMNRAIVEVGDWFDMKHGKSFNDFVLINGNISYLPKEEQVQITQYMLRILTMQLPKTPNVVEATVIYPEMLAGRKLYFHTAEIVGPVDMTADDAVAMDIESLTPEKIEVHKFIFSGVTNSEAFHKERHPMCCKQYGPAKVLDWMERFAAFIIGGMPEKYYLKYAQAMRDLTDKIGNGDAGYPVDNDYVMVYFSDTDTIRAIHSSAIEVEMQLLA